MAPLIGITGRRLSLGLIAGTSERFRAVQVNSFMADFDRCVAAAGGLPVDLPFEAATRAMVERLDGLIITGGQDIHPRRWGGAATVDSTVDPRMDPMAHDHQRDAYEATLIEAALEVGLPLLGVCRGHQLLNVVLGGTLIEHLDEGAVAHNSRLSAPTNGGPEHIVSFEQDSLLAQVYGASAGTNSWHHQAVDRLGEGLVVTARADDGVIEGIELPGRLVVGVQWHPEWMALRDPIFDWLVSAADQTSQALAGALADGRSR